MLMSTGGQMELTAPGSDPLPLVGLLGLDEEMCS